MTFSSGRVRDTFFFQTELDHGEFWSIFSPLEEKLIHWVYILLLRYREQGSPGAPALMETWPSAQPWLQPRSLYRILTAPLLGFMSSLALPLLLLGPVILLFLSTGQATSLSKTEDLLETVKKLQKGQVSCVPVLDLSQTSRVRI